MAAWIRHYFHLDPYELDTDAFAMHWREAQYLIEQTRPIQTAPQ